MRRRDEPPREGNMKQLIALLAVGFVITLGVVIGTRMSSDAIAVLVGVIAGVAASIPTALLLMAVTRRREPEQPATRDEMHRTMPPVIVVTPGGMPQQQLPYPLSYPYQASPSGRGRQFRVMGYDEEDEPIEGEAQEMPWYR